MKRIFLFATLALVVGGCQQSTSTGPATAPGATADSGDQKKLTVSALSGHTVKQGDTDNVLVTINRDNFNDAVSLSLSALPAGVTAETVPTIAADDTSATIVLKAQADAAVGEHQVTLVAEAPGLEKNSQKFTLKVVAAGT